MPKFKITWGERYPDFDLEEEGALSKIEIELTEAEYQQFLSVQKTYNYWQDKLEAGLNARHEKEDLELARKFKAGEITEDEIAGPKPALRSNYTSTDLVMSEQWYRYRDKIKKLAASLGG